MRVRLSAIPHRSSRAPLLLLLAALAACAADGGDGDVQAEPAAATTTPAAAPLPAPSPTAVAAEPADSSFAAFWPRFRDAVLADDTAALVALTRFPFRTRGQSDADPVVAHDPAAFPALLGRLLAQDPGLGGGAGDTMRRLIERTTTVDTANEPPDEVAVGDLVFTREEHRWRLASAYTNP